MNQIYIFKKLYKFPKKFQFLLSKIANLFHEKKNKTIGTYLFTYLPTYFLLTYLSIYLLTYLRTYLLTYLLTYLSTYLPTCLPTYLLTYLLTYLPTYRFGAALWVQKNSNSGAPALLQHVCHVAAAAAAAQLALAAVWQQHQQHQQLPLCSYNSYLAPGTCVYPLQSSWSCECRAHAVLQEEVVVVVVVVVVVMMMMMMMDQAVSEWSELMAIWSGAESRVKSSSLQYCEIRFLSLDNIHVFVAKQQLV
jgi:hypothetical protein